MNYENRITDKTIIVYNEASIYSKDALFKCLYWYSDKFQVSINSVEDKYYEIKLKPNSSFVISNEDLQYYLLKLERDIIDFNLRDIITKETANVRDLLIAKAFSHFDSEDFQSNTEAGKNISE